MCVECSCIFYTIRYMIVKRVGKPQSLLVSANACVGEGLVVMDKSLMQAVHCLQPA